MTSVIQYQDASSTATEISKRRYGDSSSAASSRKPLIYKFAPPDTKSEAASKHSKFGEFAARLERDPSRAKKLSSARADIAEAIYAAESVTLKILRLRAGLTQNQLAVILGTSQPHIARLECGRQEPNIASLKKLSVAFQTSVDCIISAIDNQAKINEAKPTNE